MESQSLLNNSAKYCTYDTAPSFLQGNPYIVYYYRINHSFCDVLKSIFLLHNQTLNIYTHLGSAFLFLFFAFRFFPVFNIPALVYLTVSVSLFVVSGIYHWFGCLSKQIYFTLTKIDLAFITFQIMASIFSTVCVVFSFSILLEIIMTSFGVVLASISLFLLVFKSEVFSDPNNAKLRALIFGAQVLLLPFSVAILFVLHLLQARVSWFIFELCLYTLGALIYVCRFPERFVPRTKFFLKFFGVIHSHVLFHFCVSLAVGCHWLFLFDNNSNQG
ncbi:hypothetical protein RCL1_007746 [Eukaryota sp. TZLM3-RCL]